MRIRTLSIPGSALLAPPKRSQRNADQRSDRASSRFRRRILVSHGVAGDPVLHVRRPLHLRCRHGCIAVFLIDMRTDSPSEGRVHQIKLDARAGQLVVESPAGVAIAWQALSPAALIELRTSERPRASDILSICSDSLATPIEWPIEPSDVRDQVSHALRMEEAAAKQVLARTNPQSQRTAPQQTLNPKNNSDKIKTTKNTKRTPTPEHLGGRNRPRILVLGSSGQLGSHLLSTLQSQGTVIGACRRPNADPSPASQIMVDVSRPASIRRAIQITTPDLVVNATGIRDADFAEANPRTAQLVNATAPAVIASEAKRIGAATVHFCSDMVLGGDLERPYTEADQLQPINQCGRTKLMGTRAVQEISPSHLIFRVGWLYSAQSKNFVSQFLTQAAYRDSLTLASDHFGSPISASWLAATISEILGNADGAYVEWMSQFGGLYNASLVGYGSRLAVGDFLMASLDRQHQPMALRTLHGQPLAKLRRVASVPANCRLNPSLLARTFDLSIPRWQDELERHLQSQGGYTHRVFGEVA